MEHHCDSTVQLVPDSQPTVSDCLQSLWGRGSRLRWLSLNSEIWGSLSIQQAVLLYIVTHADGISLSFLLGSIWKELEDQRFLCCHLVWFTIFMHDGFPEERQAGGMSRGGNMNMEVQWKRRRGIFDRGIRITATVPYLTSDPLINQWCACVYWYNFPQRCVLCEVLKFCI